MTGNSALKMVCWANWAFIFLHFHLFSQRGLVASFIQFKCTKYFRDDLTLVLNAVFQF